MHSNPDYTNVSDPSNRLFTRRAGNFNSHYTLCYTEPGETSEAEPTIMWLAPKSATKYTLRGEIAT